ncbi:MAG: hypothetical protein V1875_08120 [Candidatus Altiarchaeota archaeon]
MKIHRKTQQTKKTANADTSTDQAAAGAASPKTPEANGLILGLVPRDKALIAILFIGALVVWNAKVFMSFHEGMEYVNISTNPVGKLINQEVWADQPPVYFLILKGWTAFFGMGGVSIRSLLFMCYMGLIVATYRASMLTFGSRFGALLSSFLVALNPLVVWFVFDPKYWMVFAFLSLLSYVFFIRFRQTGSLKHQLLWGLSAAILPGICLPGFGVVLGYSVYSLSLIVLRRMSLKKFIIPAVIILIVSAPVSYQLGKAQQHLTTSQSGGAKGLDVGQLSLKEIADYYRAVSNHILLLDSVEGVWRQAFMCLLLILAAYGIISNVRNGFARLLILQAIITLVGGFIASKYTIVRLRYFILAAPIIVFLAANALPRIRFKWVLNVATAFLIVSYSAFFCVFFQGLAFPDWKDAGQIVNGIYDGQEIVVVHGWRFQDAFSKLYLDGKKVRAYESLKDVRLPNADNIILIHDDDDWPTKTEKFKEVFRFTRTWAMDGVYVHELKKIKPTDLLSGKFKQAGVNLIENGRTIDCRRAENAQQCFGEYWQNIDVVSLQVGAQERECIFAHPRQNQTVEIAYKDETLRESLTVWAGIEDGFVAEEHLMSPCYVDVLAGAQMIDRVIIPSVPGYFAYTVDTSAYAGRKGVSFRIYTDYDEKRHLCFNAEVSDERLLASDDYFFRNIGLAKVSLIDEKGDSAACGIWQNDSIYPHAEKAPPFQSLKLYERWDCEPDLARKNAIWRTYARTYASNGGIYEDVLWVHPHAGKTKRIEYFNVPSRGALEGFFGFDDVALKEMPQGTDTTFTVYVNGKRVLSDTLWKREGWTSFELTSLPRGPANITFETKARSDRWAHFFFNAYLK